MQLLGTVNMLGQVGRRHGVFVPRAGRIVNLCCFPCFLRLVQLKIVLESIRHRIYTDYRFSEHPEGTDLEVFFTFLT